jgi:hypothetical protein
VFAYNGNRPESVLKILTERVTQAGPGPVPGSNRGRMPDLTAGGNNPEVEFVILTLIQTLVE